MEHAGLDRAGRLDDGDARTVRATVRLSAGAPGFQVGLAETLKRLPSVRSVESGDTRARLVTRTRGAGGSVLVRVEVQQDVLGDRLEVVLTPAVRFVLGVSTTRLQSLGREVLEALEEGFASED